MKNCLFYTSCLQRGGTERMVCVYAGYLQKRGLPPVVLTNFRLEEEYALEDGIERIALEEEISESRSRVLNYVRRLRRIRRLCREREIEVAVAFARANAVRLCLAALGLRTRVVVAIRTNPAAEFPPGVWSFVTKKLFGLADGFLFQTRQQRDFFGPAIAARSAVIPNSIADDFLAPRQEGRRDWRIVSVGRLIPCKNHIMLMRAFARIAAEFPEAELVIYGDGVCRAKLLEERGRLGMEERIRLPGETKRAAEAIRDARLFVLSSDYEGMPNALLEAMALGIPSIATDCPCGGCGEIIQNGKNGILIPVGAQEELEGAMRRLLRDEAMQRRFSEEGQKVRETYSEEKTLEQLCRYLEQVAQR